MKKVLFITGTRADFGKLKSLISAVSASSEYSYEIFVTGMHLVSQYGNTYKEVEKSGFKNFFLYMNQTHGDRMEAVMANTMHGLSRYLDENPADLIVVHGDRVEALAGATVGALRNTLVAHVEGGELSGTIDDLMRHATSKLSHIHFVASEVAAKRLMQLGESPDAVFTIGSPDVDVMMSDSIPTLATAKERYEIAFDEYAIAMLHPVTTEYKTQKINAKKFIDTLIESQKNYVLVYPNNDLGSDKIFEELERVKSNSRFRLFPSLRFEYFLALLKNAQFIVGNSSAGIHEAPVYGVPTVNVGTRQNNRFKHVSIVDVDFNMVQILDAIESCLKMGHVCPTNHYGDGKSAEKFLQALNGRLWDISAQKVFRDIQYV